ncbi:MAG: TIGR03915 family putative DNA repair protein [Lachnospiraceae bacterium]|nr:TIGR03915 family putative DNA repair protein [Lachnospiraceae bacterium]
MRVYLCEDSVDGIFTGVYDAWASRLGHDNVKLLAQSGEVYEPELFCEYQRVETDPEKAGKVLKTIRNRISEYAAQMLIRACCSADEEKADDIYRFIVLGLNMGRRTSDQLSDPHVMSIFEKDRQVGNEAHHYLGFLRFSRVKEGVLFAEFEPKGDITAIVAPHFADRLPDENFIICDRRRRKAAVHPAGDQWFLTEVSEELLQKMEESSDRGDEYRNLWKVFFTSIGIEERRNEKLQNNLLPKRFRSMMTEFQIYE